MTGLETHAWIKYGGGQELWDELSAEFNVKGFPVASTGVQMGGWFRKEINTVDDLKGLKMRMPGLGGEVLRALGATPVNLPGGEIFPALQSGAIDATEWVGPWHDLAFGFYKVAKNYYFPGFHEPGTVTSVGINKELFDSLPADQQALITVVCEAEAHTQGAEFNARNQTALDTLVNKHSVNLARFSDELLVEVKKAADQTAANMAAGDAMTKKVYDSYKAYEKNALRWADIGERGYMNARTLG